MSDARSRRTGSAGASPPGVRLTRREALRAGLAGAACVAGWDHVQPLSAGQVAPAAGGAARPNIVLAMTDDQGWGDVGYNGHPHLKTPNLDAMAGAGIRFDRFYAAAPVCSPTRGSCMTGRHPNRYGCFLWGRPIRPEEITIAQALKLAGYTTGHFGKWHLNGKSGAGRAIPASDPLSPGRCGFDAWVSAHNYFDLNPSLGRNGKPEKFTGDGSDVIVDEAVKFIRAAAEKKQPFLAVVWYGSPHGPHRAMEKDKAPYADRPPREQNYYGELTAVDRSMGRLRAELRDLGIADNTLVWFCSDNGGAFGKLSVGGLRGAKGNLFEGGLRVPGILEWPARVKKPFRTSVPCCTSDFYPTILDLIGLKVPKQVRPIDGVSLVRLIDGKMTERAAPIGFEIRSGRIERSTVKWAAWTDDRYKLHKRPRGGRRAAKAAEGAAKKPDVWGYSLYDLVADPKETKDLAAGKPEVVAKMTAALGKWQASVADSLRGKDYGS